jgi:hypothetical protein
MAALGQQQSVSSLTTDRQLAARRRQSLLIIKIG